MNQIIFQSRQTPEDQLVLPSGKKRLIWFSSEVPAAASVDVLFAWVELHEALTI